jgi:hypothetical protein
MPTDADLVTVGVVDDVMAIARLMTARSAATWTTVDLGVDVVADLEPDTATPQRWLAQRSR